MEAFGGVGVHATTPAELRKAMEEAIRSKKPTLINAVIDETAGTESGRITSLNPKRKEEVSEKTAGDQPMEALKGRTHPRHDPRAGRPDLLAVACLDGRGRDQVRESGGRRDARAAARRAEGRQPVLHDAQLQQALDHREHEERRGQAGVRRPAEEVRHHHGEFRPRRARPLRLHLGEDPRDQSEDRDGLDQGLRFLRPLCGIQGLRERRAGDGRRDEHHRRAGRPAVCHRRADRRLGHRSAPRDRPARGAAARPTGRGRDSTWKWR